QKNVGCREHVSVDGQSTHVLILSELLDCSAVPVAELTEIVKVGRRLAIDSGPINVKIPAQHIGSELTGAVRNILPFVFVGVHSGTHSTDSHALDGAVDKVEVVCRVIEPCVAFDDLYPHGADVDSA
ncbi:hypothetical protein PFISCL1PPCAC_11719, partial [Pristionchus fissidentatus]